MGLRFARMYTPHHPQSPAHEIVAMVQSPAGGVADKSEVFLVIVPLWGSYPRWVPSQKLLFARQPKLAWGGLSGGMSREELACSGIPFITFMQHLLESLPRNLEYRCAWVGG